MGGGGEGNFQLARIFFFRSRLVQKFFFQVKPSARIFFFRQILLFEKVTDRPTQTPPCGFTVAARKPLKFCSGEYVFERFTFSEKLIDRPTQALLCGFTIATRKPSQCCSDEYVLERR